MEHLTLKAVTTPMTDQGVFEAVISTASIDREKDIVEPAALVAALKKWNRPVPLAWNHSTAAEDIIGSIEPMTARVQNHEVIVQGTVDLESKRGAEAWRSFKSGSIGFSYGYLVPDGGAKERKGGGQHITELDVFEVTATPTPMNNDTRVLGWKAMPAEDLPEAVLEALKGLVLDEEAKVDLLRKAQEALGVEYPQQAEVTDQEPDKARSVDPLKKEARELVLDLASDGKRLQKPPTEEPEPPREVPEHLAQKREARRLMLELLS